jgi:heme/copper-type cytochrome/quinol oxidase subunit 4
MAIAEAQKSDSLSKDIVVYICLLALAALQFFIAYQNIDPSQMLVRMLAVAVIEAGLAGIFFMHLGAERRGFLVFVVVFTIFVLLTMQFSWTDSFRVLVGAQFAK